MSINLNSVKPNMPRVIAITGGKGGIGKTCLTVNLAMALAENAIDTMILDADLGLANIDVLLGLQCRFTLADLVEGRCQLPELITVGPKRVKIIPAASGINSLANISALSQRDIIDQISALPDPPEILLIDTAAGISAQVVQFTSAASDVLVILCNEPTALADAYATIKVLSQRGVKKFYVLTNMLRQPDSGQQLFHKLRNVVDRFLQVDLLYLGAIPYDEYLRLAVQKQQPVVLRYPEAMATKAFQVVAKRILAWPKHDDFNGRIAFYTDRPIGQVEMDKDVV